MMFTFFITKFISPDIRSNAETETVTKTVGQYTMSMSTDINVTIDITPTSNQQVFTESSNVVITNTCSAGATISIETVSSTSNKLERVGSDNKTKTIDSIDSSSTTLSDNSWGYSINDGETYNMVPLRNTNPPSYIYNEERARTSDYTIPILFGVKTNNTLPSGNYNTDIIYTMSPKSGCLTYNVTWDLDGGTGASGKTYPTTMNFDQTVNLSELTPTKQDYIFAGWKVGTNDFTGEETEANINPDGLDSITITAQWEADVPSIPTGACTGTYGSQVNVNLAVNGTQNFDYTGNVQCAYLQKAGYYKLEVWGAQGGSAYDTNTLRPGGKGGYSYGNIYSSENSSIYVVVGQQGANRSASDSYNGGGACRNCSYTGTSYTSSSGGGASHVSTVNCGELRNCSSQQANIVIVAGGGGGFSNGNGSGSADENNGGGFNGANAALKYSYDNVTTAGTGGTQSSGGYSVISGSNVGQGGFGYGGSANNISTGSGCGAGGGGGWYGGGATVGWNPGGGGSGYIGNSLLLSDKGMYMYSTGCIASTAESTKTTCTGSTGHATANAANTGNGYAKITYLGTSI